MTRDYRPEIMRIAATADGFEWNPYSERQIHRTAAKLRKQGLLVVAAKKAPSRVILRSRA